MKTNLTEAVFGNRPTGTFHWVFLGFVSLFLCAFLECPKIVQRVHVEISIQKGLNKSRVNNLKILVTHDLFSFRNDVSDEFSIDLKAALLPASALILRHVYLANHFP